MIVPFEPIKRFPQTVILLTILSEEALVPLPIVKFLQVEVPFKAGWNTPVKLASPIMASTAEVGTPEVQFEAVVQLVLVTPLHEVVWALKCKEFNPKMSTIRYLKIKRIILFCGTKKKRFPSLFCF